MKQRRKPRELEHVAQKNLLRWTAYARGTMPELELLFAIPNGGLRNAKVAGKLKAEGVKAGVPDLFLPVARGGFHGLFIELKIGRNKPSATQASWHDRLRDQGYAVAVCYGWEEAKTILETYLAGDTKNV